MEEPPDPNAAQLLQQEAAYVLSYIRDTCKTSQKAADAVVAGFDKLLNIFLDVLNDKVESTLSNRNGYIKVEEIKTLIDKYKGQSVFEGVSKKPYLEAYIRKKSGGRKVSLQKIVLESKTVIKSGKSKKIDTKWGYRVPFVPQLEQLLNCRDVMDCVNNPMPSQPGVFKSVTDGLFYKYHPVVKRQNEKKEVTLVFIAHVDDVDPCDALKSKSGKHNMRLFYWVLANIPPEKRSTLRAINLMAIVRSKVAKEKGNSHFMQDFIDALKLLGTEGIELTINNEVIRFFGILMFVAADNPASCNIGGFKETWCALRPCRMCTVKSEDMCKHFRADLNLIRKLLLHRQMVKKVTASKKPSSEDNIEVVDINLDENDHDNEHSLEELPQDHDKPSINYGINGESILAVLPGFDETKCLTQDPLHLLAEGVVEHVCRLVLKDLCIAPKVHGKRTKPLIKLQVINNIIQDISNLGHLSASKPTVILKEHLTGSKLRQSGSQMFVLLYVLPFTIQGICPQKKIDLVITLIKLVNHCMSFELTKVDIDNIEDLVDEFGSSFKKLYPTVNTLKLHALVHLGAQVRFFGPIRQHACFHFEAMHSKFTSIAPVIHYNMKDFAFSSASRVLNERNSDIMKSKDNGTFLYAGDILKGSSEVTIETLVEKDCLLQKFPYLGPIQEITKVDEIVQHSNRWHEGVVLLIEYDSKKPEKAVFGRISSLYVVDGQYTFVYMKYKTHFVSDLHAHHIDSCSGDYHSVKYMELRHKFPVTRFTFNYKRKALAYLLLQNVVGSVESN